MIAAIHTVRHGEFQQHHVRLQGECALYSFGAIASFAGRRGLDPAFRLDHLRASFFIAAATDDFFFWPPGVEATLAATDGYSNQVYAPNVTHKLPVPGGSNEKNRFSWVAMEERFMNWHLKGVGAAMPVVRAQPADAPLEATFTVAGFTGGPSAQVY